MSRAAELIQSSGISASSLTLGRKISGGKTLLDIAADGGDVEGAASKLVTMLRNEAERRKRVSASLAMHRKTSGATEDDSTPVYIERG